VEGRLIYKKKKVIKRGRTEAEEDPLKKKQNKKEKGGRCRLKRELSEEGIHRNLFEKLRSLRKGIYREERLLRVTESFQSLKGKSSRQPNRVLGVEEDKGLLGRKK